MKTTILGLFGLSACVLHAAILVTPASISYVTTPNQEEGFNLDNEDNLINGNGLSAIPDFSNYTTVTHDAVSFDAPGNVWATTDPGGPGSYFFESGGINPVFEMTFDRTYALTDFVYWGYHFDTPNGNEGSDFFLQFSTDGGLTYPTEKFVFGAFGDLAAENSRTLSLQSTVDANAVRMTIFDNRFFTEFPGGDRVGLGELRFVAVPEPSTGLLASLAGLAFLRRRR